MTNFTDAQQEEMDMGTIWVWHRDSKPQQ